MFTRGKKTYSSTLVKYIETNKMRNNESTSILSVLPKLDCTLVPLVVVTRVANTFTSKLHGACQWELHGLGLLPVSLTLRAA